MKKKVFIGSSLKYLVLADALKEQFVKENHIEIVTWSDYFETSGGQNYTYETLIKAVKEFEFAVFFITKDYKLNSHKPNSISTPNVWFEAGLWMSRYGKENVLLFQEKNESYSKDLLFLSDLTGLQPQYWTATERINKDVIKKRRIPSYSIVNSTVKKDFKKAFAPLKGKIKSALFDDDEGIIGLSTNLKSRLDCYREAEEIIDSAQEYVYTILSYEDELTDRRFPNGLLPYIEKKVIELNNDPSFDKSKSKDFFKRWMNIANEKIAKQAEYILTKYHNKIEIRDTYCNFIEAVITENRVLLLLPNPKNRRAQVGKGVLIKSRKLAQEFTDWFQHYLPEPNEIILDSVSKLKDYRDFEWDMLNKRNGVLQERCNSCFVKWVDQDNNIKKALKAANLK